MTAAGRPSAVAEGRPLRAMRLPQAFPASLRPVRFSGYEIVRLLEVIALPLALYVEPLFVTLVTVTV